MFAVAKLLAIQDDNLWYIVELLPRLCARVSTGSDQPAREVSR